MQFEKSLLASAVGNCQDFSRKGAQGCVEVVRRRFAADCGK